MAVTTTACNNAGTMMVSDTPPSSPIPGNATSKANNTSRKLPRSSSGYPCHASATSLRGTCPHGMGVPLSSRCLAYCVTTRDSMLANHWGSSTTSCDKSGFDGSASPWSWDGAARFGFPIRHWREGVPGTICERVCHPLANWSGVGNDDIGQREARREVVLDTQARPPHCGSTPSSGRVNKGTSVHHASHVVQQQQWLMDVGVM